MTTLKDLTGKMEVTATLDSNHILENKQYIANNIIKQIAEQGGKAKIQGNLVVIENSGQHFRLPTLDKVRTGTITFRSKDFIFSYTDSTGKEHNSYCDKPKASDLLENGNDNIRAKQSIQVRT
jgi:hypothetical protein